jgi:diphthamide synthase (EF-2-diphthine--ammonia ligase)
MPGRLIGLDVEDLLEAHHLRELREALLNLSPYDVADLIGDLSHDQCAIVFRILPRNLAAEVFENLSVDDQEHLLSSLSQERCRQIVEEMAPDDRTALLEELPDGVDPCGENGEFHTFATAGPMFDAPIAVAAGPRVERDGFVFADLLPAGSPESD